jgi:hypothetical protein
MAHHYVVTAHKPTAVTACVTGKTVKNILRYAIANFHYSALFFVEIFCLLGIRVVVEGLV